MKEFACNWLDQLFLITLPRNFQFFFSSNKFNVKKFLYLNHPPKLILKITLTHFCITQNAKNVAVLTVLTPPQKKKIQLFKISIPVFANEFSVATNENSIR